MNHHLNFFRFFNESEETEFIENNLSRAFSLCLKTSGFFLNEFVKRIVSEEDHRYLFSVLTNDTKCDIDIQIDTATIEKENYKTAYVVAMTTDRKLDIGDFFEQAEFADKKNVTDIFISIKDIAIIIEVKRSGEDCKAQLYNQALPFIKCAVNGAIEVKPVCCSWQDVVSLMERVKHVQKLLSQDAHIISDFLELSEIRYPHWFEPKPFITLPFTHNGNPQLTQRLKQGLAGVCRIAGDDYQLLPYGDRLGISLPFGWVSEFIPYFSHSDSDGVDYVECCIWPANTKAQGYSVFTGKSLDWVKKRVLLVGGAEYPLSVEYEVKFSHFNGYITGIRYLETDIVKPLHTPENYRTQSGKWNRASWSSLERLFDEHFEPDFRWREHCGWAEKFLDTDRSYLTMSLGFVVTALIPFSKFKSIDKKDADITNVSELLWKVVLAFNDLIK
jgi:hypothetical protein